MAALCVPITGGDSGLRMLCVDRLVVIMGMKGLASRPERSELVGGLGVGFGIMCTGTDEVHNVGKRALAHAIKRSWQRGALLLFRSPEGVNCLEWMKERCSPSLPPSIMRLASLLNRMVS